VKAGLLLAPQRIEIKDIATPCVNADEVLIHSTCAGICGSDVSLYAGHRTAKYPLLLGHEVVGRVNGLGKDVTKFSAGQRVVVEPNYPCGVCSFCRAGRGNICPDKKSAGVTISGCFAELFTAPAEFVWAVPDSISDADAVTLEPLAVSLHALWQSGAQMGDTVAVLGCGATGLLLIHAAVMQGVRVFAFDKLTEKMEFARRLGADVVQSDDVEKLWRDQNVSTIFECAGVPATVELALSAAPRGSQVVLLGLATSPASFVPLRLVRGEVRVSGSIIYNHPSDFARTIALVASGVLHPSRVITDTLPFDSIDRALQLASTGQSGKVLLQM
jgi:2-desacetyl-2-hydroxyethyl bacteriochlorophyllide A dehydrogenase